MLRTSDLNKYELSQLRRLSKPVNLATANGVVSSDTGFSIHINELDIDDEVHVCDGAPKGMGVLSLGKLMRDHRCRFHWIGDKCVFTTGAGEHLKVDVDQNVPFISSEVYTDTSAVAKCLAELGHTSPHLSLIHI